ncbi:MAG: ABC transporter ATP-binding protein [Candidatus Bathyarchaeia archaeon]
MSTIICEVKNLKKYFPIHGGILGLQTVAYVRAVNGVSFDIEQGETFGLVGESGCGKTTTAKCILGILPPTSGEIKFMGQSIFKGKMLRSFRRYLGVVFQDPFTSLTPTMTIEDIVGEPLEVHRLISSRQEKRKIVRDLLEKVGIPPQYISRYPHEFSGGERQRIAIARALASKPKFIVADEPVASLDVSLRADILNLMLKLKREFEITYLFISHDLSVIKYICDRVAIMYLGKIVEIAPVEELFKKPQHPYTRALISAVPIPDPTVKKERIILYGDVPNPVNPPLGCRFHPRCYQYENLCKKKEPELFESRKNHFVACFKYY